MRIRIDGRRFAAALALQVSSGVFLVLAVVCGVMFSRSEHDSMRRSAMAVLMILGGIAVLLSLIAVAVHARVREARLDRVRRTLSFPGGSVDLDRVRGILMTASPLDAVSSGGAAYRTHEYSLLLVTDRADPEALDLFERPIPERGSPVRAADLERFATAVGRSPEASVIELLRGAGERYARDIAVALQRAAGVPRLELGTSGSPVVIRGDSSHRPVSSGAAMKSSRRVPDE